MIFQNLYNIIRSVITNTTNTFDYENDSEVVVGIFYFIETQ